MCADTPILTVTVLLEELQQVDDWYMLGAYLNVPVHEMNKISVEHKGVERCKLYLLQFWLNTTMTASWRDVARAVEQLNLLTLAARLKSKYLWIAPGECVCVCVCVCLCVCACDGVVQSFRSDSSLK